MSDVNEEEVTAEDSGVKQIVIDISDSNVSYTSEMSVVEVVFWLDVVHAMLMSKLTTSQEGV